MPVVLVNQNLVEVLSQTKTNIVLFWLTKTKTKNIF